MSRSSFAPLVRHSVVGSLLFLAGFVCVAGDRFPVTQAQQSPPAQTPPASAETPQPPSIQVGLVPGIQLEGELQAEQKHSFTVQLEANQYVRIEVEQQGIDVIVRLFDPAGKQVQEMDSPNGTKGPEYLRHVTVEAGTYRVEVAGLEKGAKPGKYTIRLGEVRPPQPDDAAVIHYDQLANRVKILLGVERFQEVLPIAEQLVTAAAEAY
ncbi:MAG: PPC domain-containing protein, partial [Acidobacteria bacterium]|nr:PPC domain-containing protein [Acidobacteriota bacterium]